MGLECGSCGAGAPEGARFCPVCGAALSQVCPTCGSEQPGDAAYCSSCGAALRPGARDAGPEQEERRVVTVLFADLAGSTALGERLDPEDLRIVQSQLFELVNGEVERFGGVSEKFVGDAVMAVFGIPQTHEDDAERAVRAGLAVQQAFSAFAAAVGERHGATGIGLRVGVNTGEVVVGREAAARGELMVSGDAVNVAARLQQLAEPGTVLVGARARAATQRVVSYQDVGSLAAKGKERPLRAWRALEATGEQRARSEIHSARLIGRDDDLALLRLTAARVARDRTPQLVTIFGQAGVGKSRLVEELASELDSGRVVVGRCVPYGDGITYLPLAQVASELAGILADDRADVALAKLRESIETTVPPGRVADVLQAVAWTLGLLLPGHTAGLDGAGDVKDDLHDAWAWYLSALGRDELLVLVIDDVHWASAALLDVVEHVVDAVENSAVLVLCPSRPEILETRPTWGTGRLNASSLTLAPLGTTDAESLLEALLDGATLPPPIARAILDPAEGNPFFVEEMLSMLVEQGAVEKWNGGWVATGQPGTFDVPDSIHGVIAARIDLLEASEREALRTCSVMGRVFWPSAVEVEENLIAGLGRRALVSEVPLSSFSGRREFAYKHALTHEVAYATLARPERRVLHRRVAEWLEDEIPDRLAETTELVAYHFEQALLSGEPDPELQRQAFDALLAAGEAAQRRGAYVSSEGLLGRALGLVPSEDERAWALLAAARVDVHTTKYDRAIARLDQAIQAAEIAGDDALRADALGVRARAAWLGGRWQEAFDSGIAAVGVLEGLPESEELARALSRLSQIEMLRALPSAEATSRRAIEVARRTGERAAEANARVNLFTAESFRGVVPSLDEVQQIIDLALAAGAHDEGVRAVVNFLWSAGLLGSLEPVEQFVEEMAATRVVRGLRAEAYEGYLRLSLAALIYVPSGRWSEADEVVADEASTATNRLVWLWLVTGLALRRGDLEGADSYLPELRAKALESEEPHRILPMATVSMPRAVLAGDAPHVQWLADRIAELPTQTVSISPTTMAIPRSLVAIRDRARLEALLERFPDQGLGTTLGAGLLAGLAGRPEEAASILLGVEESLHSLGRGYDAACVALDAAHALDASGDSRRAEAARARAAAVLEPLACVNPY